MASPDISEYLDLTVYDKQPAELYDDAIEYARSALPEWDPATGSVEDAIVQAMALLTAELIGAINRVPAGIFEAVLKLFDVTRQSGTKPTATATFEMIDDLGYTIPADTRIGYVDSTDPDSIVLYTFDTDSELVITPGNTTGTVAITGVSSIEYPELAGATSLRLLTPISTVDSVILATALAIGADPETDSEYFTRATAKLASYSTALVLTDQFSQYILSTYPAVYRCKGYSRLNPLNNDWNDALEDGYLTIYACGTGGASLSVEDTTAIEEDVTNRAVAGLVITIDPPSIVGITVDVTVTLTSGYSQTNVIDAVEAALNEYLHPDFWEWEDTIHYNEVIALVSNVAGVGRVVDLTLGSTGGTQVVDVVDLQFLKYGALPLVTPTVTVQT